MTKGRGSGAGGDGADASGVPRTRRGWALWTDRRQRATREHRAQLWSAAETNNRTSFDLFTGHGMQPVGSIRGLGLPTPPDPTGGAGSARSFGATRSDRGPFDPPW